MVLETPYDIWDGAMKTCLKDILPISLLNVKNSSEVPFQKEPSEIDCNKFQAMG